MILVPQEISAEATALEMRLFRRRVKDPAATLDRLRSRLRAMGLIRVCIAWCGADAHFVGLVGRKRLERLRRATRTDRKEVVYADVLKVAKQLAFEPGVEDVGVWMRGRKVTGVISAVPFTVMTEALDRLCAKSPRQR